MSWSKLKGEVEVLLWGVRAYIFSCSAAQRLPSFTCMIGMKPYAKRGGAER